MDSQLLIAAGVTTVAIVLASFVALHHFKVAPLVPRSETAPPTDLPEPAAFIRGLAVALPESVVFPRDVAGFRTSLEVFWNQINREAIPACVVRPRNTQELSVAVKHLKAEYDQRAHSHISHQGFFAVRSGGANPANGLAGIEDGVLLDLSLLNEVVVSEDQKSVTVGTGAFWVDVYAKLEERGLAVVGGRSSPVAVGGSTLQGTFCQRSTAGRLV